MTLIGHHVVSMTRGEVTPLLHARRELEDYRRSLAECLNFRVLKYGGVTRLPGTLTLAANYSSSRKSRLIPFVFNRDQSYTLEFSHQAIRVFTETGLVSGAGTISAPWGEADLWNIQVETIGDLMYIACSGYTARVLTRNSSTSWTLSTYDPKGGPFLPLAESGRVTFNGDGGYVTPDMTSNTAPSGTCVDFKASTETFKVFNRNTTSQFTVADNGAGWLYYEFPSGVTIAAYAIRGTDRGDHARSVPISWILFGRTTTTGDWHVLDSQKLTSDWLPGETRLYDIQNKQGGTRQIKLRWLGGGDTDPALTVIGELMLLEDPDDQTTTTLTANTSDINDGDGFQSSDVGRLMRVMGGDGYWRNLRIESRTSSTEVEIVILSPAPLDPDTLVGGSHLFQIGAWSTVSGWPECVFKHKGRLGWANTSEEPRTFWLSKAGIFDDLGTSQPLTDEDAITATLDSGEVDFILWGASNNDDMFLGTAGGIRIIGKRDGSEVFGPDNVEEIGSTVVPAGNVRPVFSNLMMLFVDASGEKIYETGFSEEAGGYTARELTIMSEHVFRSGVKELHFQQAPEPTIWAVLEDGTVGICTYDREQQIFGVSRFVPPGTNAAVESMCILPIETTEVPMFLVRRTVDGSTTRRIERMADSYRGDGNSVFAYPVYLMAAATYSGSATSTITGLSYLEGETVGVYDITNDVDLGDAVVNGSGNITVPGGGTVTNALVGLRYTSRVKTLPPPNAPEDGRDIAHGMVPIRAYVDIFETYGLEIGGDRHMHALTTNSDARLDPAIPALHTGVVEAPIEEGWATLHEITLQTDTAYPATIRAIEVDFDRGG